MLPAALIHFHLWNRLSDVRHQHGDKSQKPKLIATEVPKMKMRYLLTAFQTYDHLAILKVPEFAKDPGLKGETWGQPPAATRKDPSHVKTSAPAEPNRSKLKPQRKQ
jgi:hypothetical protein